MIMIVMPMQTAWTRLGLTIALVAVDILEMEQSAQVFYQFIWRKNGMQLDVAIYLV